MILFKPEHVAPILSGRKTETRRYWKKFRVNVGSIQLAKTQMISKEYFARLEILDRWEEALGDISPRSISNEGYDSLEGYKAVLEAINKRPWDDNEVVKVVKFRVVP